MKDKLSSTSWWRSPEIIGDFTTVIAVVIAVALTVLDLFNLLEVMWFQENLTKLTLLLVSLVVISNIVERRFFITSLISKVVEEKGATDLVPTSGFMKGLTGLLKDKHRYDTLDIMASTSTLYFYALRDSEIEVNNVRLLIRGIAKPELMQSPSLDEDKLDFGNELRRMVSGWVELHKTGKIKKLDIKYYNFDPTFHFMIINGQVIHFGLYKLRHTMPGPEILNSYIMADGTNSGTLLLKDFKIAFETVWNEFAYEYKKE